MAGITTTERAASSISTQADEQGAKFTPGPWSVEVDGGVHHVNGIINGKPHWVCECFGRDAHLIAAAPTLLDAAELAIIQIEYLHENFGETGSGNQVLARLRAAIAKATQS